MHEMEVTKTCTTSIAILWAAELILMHRETLTWNVFRLMISNGLIFIGTTKLISLLISATTARYVLYLGRNLPLATMQVNYGSLKAHCT